MSCDVGGALDLERAVSFELSNDSFITLVTAARSSCKQQAAEVQSVSQIQTASHRQRRARLLQRSVTHVTHRVDEAVRDELVGEVVGRVGLRQLARQLTIHLVVHAQQQRHLVAAETRNYIYL